MSAPALSDTLSVILPTPDETWLLRACLHTGDAAVRAWEVWQERVGDPKAALREDRSGVKRLLPLLFRSLQHSGAAVDRGLLPYLRSAYLSEELRSAAYRRICRSVLSALAAESIPVILLKGAGLAETVYGDPALRHSHDIDLLLREDDVGRATVLLLPHGFSLQVEDQRPTFRHARLVHENGLPLELHTRLFRLPLFRAPPHEVWARSQAQVVADVPGRILSPADNLLHVGGQAACSGSRQSLQWVCDAWHLIAKHGDLDWEVLLDGACRCRLALPLSVLFDYLAGQLDTPMPATFLDRLRKAAAQADMVAREAALFGARASGATLRAMLQSSRSWRARALVAKWMLLPSASCVRAVEPLRHAWLLPFYYAYRPLRYVGCRLRHAARAGRLRSLTARE